MEAEPSMEVFDQPGQRPLTESERRERVAAQKMREDIAALRGLPAWGRYYEARVRKPYEEALGKVLHDETLTAEKLFTERKVLIALERVVKLLETDDAYCRQILGIRSED